MIGRWLAPWRENLILRDQIVGIRAAAIIVKTSLQSELRAVKTTAALASDRLRLLQAEIDTLQDDVSATMRERDNALADLVRVSTELTERKLRASRGTSKGNRNRPKKQKNLFPTNSNDAGLSADLRNVATG